jgi:hypothetical protein
MQRKLLRSLAKIFPKRAGGKKFSLLTLKGAVLTLAGGAGAAGTGYGRRGPGVYPFVGPLFDFFHPAIFFAAKVFLALAFSLVVLFACLSVSIGCWLLDGGVL